MMLWWYQGSLAHRSVIEISRKCKSIVIHAREINKRTTSSITSRSYIGSYSSTINIHKYFHIHAKRVHYTTMSYSGMYNMGSDNKWVRCQLLMYKMYRYSQVIIWICVYFPPSIMLTLFFCSAFSQICHVVQSVWLLTTSFMHTHQCLARKWSYKMYRKALIIQKKLSIYRLYLKNIFQISLENCLIDL